MELTPTQKTALQNLAISSAKVNSESLTVGQQVLAKVVASNPTSGEVTLSINNSLLNTRSAIPLTAGQTLPLLVAQLGKDIVLQLPQALIEQATTQKTLLQSLPQQRTQTETLKNLQNLAQQGKSAGISDKIIQFTQKFIQQLPGTQQLSNPQSLKEVIQRSGIFLENKLANIQNNRGDSNIRSDFKSFLLQLRSLLVNEQKPTQLRPQPQNLKPSTTNNKVNAPQTLNNESKILDIAKQIKTEQIKLAEEGKFENGKPITGGQQTQATSQQVKNALQQALAKINQQQKNISQNLSRLLAATGQVISPLTRTPSKAPTQGPQTDQSSNGKSANIALKDALAFTANTQKTHQTEINFSRLNNLMDLLDTLVKQVDSGISRIQLHQLNSLIEPEGNKLGWSMEIPVKIDDELHSIHLQLEKEPAADEETDPILTVNIALDLQNLGPVHARITLIGENVGVVMWAEQEDTYQLTQDHVENLENNLFKSGLKPDNIRFHRGQPPHNPVLNKTDKSSLLDVRV